MRDDLSERTERTAGNVNGGTFVPPSHGDIFRLLYGEQARFFEDEIRPHLKHKRKGIVGMASAGENLNASQFYITTGEDLDSLDEKHTIFGQVWRILTPCFGSHYLMQFRFDAMTGG